MQHACGHGRIGDLVDQDETAQGTAVGIGFEYDGLVGRDFGDTDRVQLERLGSKMLQRVDVYLVFGLGDSRRNGLGCELKPIGAPRKKGLVIHPHDGRFELVGAFRRIVRRADNIAARAIDFVFERQCDRLARARIVQFTIECRNRLHDARLARRQDANGIAGLHISRGDQPRKAPEIEIGPVDPLHRHAERLFAIDGRADLNLFEMFDQAWATVPRRVG